MDVYSRKEAPKDRLEVLGDILSEKEELLMVQFLPVNPPSVLLNTLLVDMPVNDSESESKWRIECSCIPNSDTGNGLSTLSCFATVCMYNPQFGTEVLCLLNILNTRLPLGAFTAVPNASFISYRTFFILPPEDTVAVEIMASGCWISSYLLTTFASAIIQVATGTQTAAESITGHPLAAAFQS